MHVEYDSEADAIYITLREPEGAVETEFIDDSRYVDYDEAGNAVGIELLGLSQGIHLTGLPEASEVAAILNEIRRPKVAV